MKSRQEQDTKTVREIVEELVENVIPLECYGNYNSKRIKCLECAKRKNCESRYFFVQSELKLITGVDDVCASCKTNNLHTRGKWCELNPQQKVNKNGGCRWVILDCDTKLAGTSLDPGPTYADKIYQKREALIDTALSEIRGVILDALNYRSVSMSVNSDACRIYNETIMEIRKEIRKIIGR